MGTENLTLTTSTTLYDLDMLREMDDDEYLLEMLTTVLSETPADIKKMELALKEGNTSLVCKQAHKLKSSAGVIEAHALINVLEEIETGGKNGQPAATLAQLIAEVRSEYQKIEKELKKEIEIIK